MSVTLWTGAVDGNFSTLGNWTNGPPGLLGVDVAMFANSAVDVDAGLDQSSKTFSVYVQYTYTGTIGSEASPLIVGTITNLAINQRKGGTHLRGNITVGYVTQTPGVPDSVTLAALTASSEVITDVYIGRCAGRAVLKGSSTIKNVYIANDAWVNIEAGSVGTDATRIDLLRMSGGIVECSSRVATVRVNGIAALTFPATATLDANDLIVDNDASVDVRCASQGGTKLIEGRLTLNNGRVTTRKNDNPGLVYDDVRMYGGRFDMRDRTRSVAVTNGVEYYGGDIVAPPGMTLTPA